MGLARARLTVGEDRAVEALRDLLHRVLKVLEHALLARARVEDTVVAAKELALDLRRALLLAHMHLADRRIDSEHLGQFESRYNGRIIKQVGQIRDLRAYRLGHLGFRHLHGKTKTNLTRCRLPAAPRVRCAAARARRRARAQPHSAHRPCLRFGAFLHVDSETSSLGHQGDRHARSK